MSCRRRLFVTPFFPLGGGVIVKCVAPEESDPSCCRAPQRLNLFGDSDPAPDAILSKPRDEDGSPLMIFRFFSFERLGGFGFNGGDEGGAS